MPLSGRAVQAIDELAASTAIREHPSLVAWSGGSLTRDDLRAFASQFYHLVDALPRAASRTHAATASSDLRAPLVSVISALDGMRPTPAELWLQTCAALGLFSDSVRRAELGTGCDHCMDTIERLSAAGIVEGTAALYVLLRQLPLVSRVLQDGLHSEYGMHGGPGMAFFDTFSYQTQAHAGTVRDLLGRAIRSDEDARVAHQSAEEALVALETLLSGALAQAEQPA